MRYKWLKRTWRDLRALCQNSPIILFITSNFNWVTIPGLDLLHSYLHHYGDRFYFMNSISFY